MEDEIHLCFSFLQSRQTVAWWDYKGMQVVLKEVSGSTNWEQSTLTLLSVL